MPGDLIELRPQGLYCPPGDFYIDPWRPVERAVITHAHADHARAGHQHYLCSAEGAALLRARLGDVQLQSLGWGETLDRHGVRLSLHPAGHVLGSAQVRVEHRGQVWVASGDYFVGAAGERNRSCSAFEPLRCHCFITESTFGLPIYRWRPQAEVMADIQAWWQHNAQAQRASLLLAYSLGKAQRLLAEKKVAVRVVSMPSTTTFDREDVKYKKLVLPAGLPRIAVEMGVTDGWWKYGCAAVVGIDCYGESAPAGVLFKHFGFTAENVADTVRAALQRKR